jgi:hypothetical protein
MLLFYGTKPYNDAPTINNSWTSLGSATDGTTVAGTDTGSMQARIFWKQHTGTETNPTVTNSTNNVSGGVIIVFSKASTSVWDMAHGGAGDATAGTGFSATTAAGISFAPNDLVAAFAALRSDAATQSSIALSASGITFGAFTESPASDLSSISGGDIAASGGYAAVTAGTSTVTLTYSSTLAAAHTGSFYAARLREIVAQDLLPPLFTNSNTLYAPTIAAGATSITAPLFTNSSTLYAPTLANRQMLESSLLTNSSTLYSPTLAPQAVTAELPLFTNSSTLYEPTVAQTAPSQNLTVPLLTNGSTLYAPTASPQAVSIEAPLFSNSSTLYSHTVAPGGVTNTLPLLSNVSTLYEPTLTSGAISIEAPLLTNTSSLYAPVVSLGAGSAQDLGLSFIDSTGTLYTPEVTLGAASVNLPLLTNSQTFYVHELAPQPVTITDDLFINVSILYPPTLAIGTGVKVYTSSGWVNCTVKAWNGSEWTGQLKVYSGDWIDL